MFYWYTRIAAWLSYHRNIPIGTYMNRWYLIPPQWNLPICVRLQHIRKPDLSRQPHNHPYAFKSIVLRGFYVEEQVVYVPDVEADGTVGSLPVTEVYHHPFKLYTIERQRYHRIIEMPTCGVWTLIFHPRKPKEYDWGFLGEDGKHIDHDHYVRPANH